MLIWLMTAFRQGTGFCDSRHFSMIFLGQAVSWLTRGHALPARARELR
jgi:hypothetical protein